MSRLKKSKAPLKSLNSWYGNLLNKTEQRILEVTKRSDIPITPLEISTKTGINHSYVRFCLRKLHRLKFVYRAFYGHYQSVRNSPTLDRVGVGQLKSGVGARCHKLLLVVRGVMDFVSDSKVVLDNRLFRVTFVGYGIGKVVVYVDCKGCYSFDYGAFLCLVEFVKAKLGVEDEKAIEVRTFELNVDHKGVQLDGVKSVTLRGFRGAFERFYNKDKQTLRNEINLQRPLTVESAYALLKGGVTPYNIFQANYLLVQEVRRLFEAVKFGNRTQAEFLQLLKVLLQKFQADI